MTKYIGRKNSIGIAKESVRGTAVVPAFWTPHLELTLDNKITQAIDESTVGVIEDVIDAKKTSDMANGTLRGIVQDNSFGLWLLATLGAVSTTLDDPESGVNKHEFTVANNATHQSLTISEKNDDVDRAFTLGMIESFDIAVILEEFISFTANFRSKTAESASNTVAYTAENKFVPQHAVAKIATDLSGLGAAGAISLKAFNMSIVKNAEDDRNFGSVDPTDILNKQFAVEGSLELLYDAQTFEDLVTGDTPQALRLELINTDVTIGASSNPTITIDLAKVKFSEIARNLTLNDIVRQTLTFKSFYSLTDAQSIDITLFNTQTSY